MDLRFLKKILTDTEIEQVRSSGDPDEALWSFWACKEAAYKVIQKKNGGAAFVPRRWSVRGQVPLNAFVDRKPSPNDYRKGEVMIPGSDPVYFHRFTCSSYVHCLAADVPGRINQIIARVDHVPGPALHQPADPSSLARTKLIRLLARELRCPENDLRIIREKNDGGLGPPILYVAGAASAVDLSISHDGQYVAYAYLV